MDDPELPSAIKYFFNKKKKLKKILNCRGQLGPE